MQRYVCLVLRGSMAGSLVQINGRMFYAHDQGIQVQIIIHDSIYCGNTPETAYS